MKNCFKFSENKVSLNSPIEVLKNASLTVDMHTDYYAHFIGVEYKEMKYGFCCYTDCLEAYIEGPYLGEIDQYHVQIHINSEECLNTFLDLIETMIKLKKLTK